MAQQLIYILDSLVDDNDDEHNCVSLSYVCTDKIIKFKNIHFCVMFTMKNYKTTISTLSK